MLAYHSVSQMGFILAGIGAAGYLGAHGAMGVAGGLYHVVNHALFKACLFLGVGAVYFRTHSLDMYHLGGLWKKMPLTFVFMCIAAARHHGRAAVQRVREQVPHPPRDRRGMGVSRARLARHRREDLHRHMRWYGVLLHQAHRAGLPGEAESGVRPRGEGRAVEDAHRYGHPRHRDHRTRLVPAAAHQRRVPARAAHLGPALRHPRRVPERDVPLALGPHERGRRLRARLHVLLRRDEVRPVPSPCTQVVRRGLLVPSGGAGPRGAVRLSSTGATRRCDTAHHGFSGAAGSNTRR